jgi:REP element-mobilizing transposase RayT
LAANACTAKLQLGGECACIFNFFTKLELGGTFKMQNNSSFHYGNLPHWQPAGATFFVTMRLAGSIPRHIIEEIKVRKAFDVQAKERELEHDAQKLATELYNIEKRYFGIFDKELDKSNEPYWLREKEIAEIVKASIEFLEGKELTTHAYCIMPNHLHWLFTHQEKGQVLWKILQRMKSFTAKQCNKILKRQGQFWEEESYDHIVRSEKECDNIIGYTLLNPVKAGFVKTWEEWEFSFVAPTCSVPSSAS